MEQWGSYQRQSGRELVGAEMRSMPMLKIGPERPELKSGDIHKRPPPRPTALPGATFRECRSPTFLGRQRSGLNSGDISTN